MARSLPRTRTSTRASVAAAPVSPRTLFLASLGAALLARREAERLAADAATVPERLRAGADAAIGTARSEVKKLAKSARARIAPLKREVDRLGSQVEAVRDQGVAEAAKRLNPLLARVGLPTITTKRRAAAPRAARKATKAAKTAKPAAARRPVAKTVAKAARRRA